MDAQCRQALRTLQQECPEVAAWAARLLAGGYSASEAKTLARALIDMARESGFDCLRALLIVLRCVAMKYPKLWRTVMGGAAGSTATTTGAAGGTAAAGGAAGGAGAAGGGAAGGAGAAGGGAAGGAAATGAAFWASLLFLLFALGFLTWRVLNELLAEMEIGEEGVMPCGGGRVGQILALSPREVVTSSVWGRKASLQAAYDEAVTDCGRLSGDCGGGCPPGMNCQAVVAVLEVEQWSSFPWIRSYTRLLYACPCYCV